MTPFKLHGGMTAAYTAAVRQTRIEDWLFFGDVVAKTTCDVPDRDCERLRIEGHTFYRLKISAALDEHVLRAVHHDLADVWIEDQVLDRAQKRQDQLEARRLSLEFSVRELPEVGLVHVVVVGLEVHEGRWQRIQAVVDERRLTARSSAR